MSPSQDKADKLKKKTLDSSSSYVPNIMMRDLGFYKEAIHSQQLPIVSSMQQRFPGIGESTQRL